MAGKYTAIDLFCGAGGLSKGFMDAGFNVILGIDNDKAALNTFALNHNGAIASNADLSNPLVFDEINKLVDNKNIDIIIAGPPCQGFSLTGPRNFDDKRNQLYLAVLELVRRFNPMGFIIENVPGMATLYGGQIKDEILRRFENMGYNVACRILCAADYGVPQLRHRLIFMGIRKDIGTPRFPVPTFTVDTYRTCRDAISDLPSLETELGSEESSYTSEPLTEYQRLMRGACSVLHNHVGTKHTQLVIDTISLVPEGGNYKDLPAGWGESRTFHEAWTRYDGNRPSKTIDTGHRNHFHYQYNRVPTIRENARLQSFPDDFVFTGTKTQQNRQVGNAVPPLLGQALGAAMLAIFAEHEANKINTIDLFAGCGGLCEGFEMSGRYDTLACVEWEKAPCQNLAKHLKDKWGYSDADKRVLRFDIQRTSELFAGWDDKDYGKASGLDSLIGGKKVDLIIGGPPCQAYSIAGRVRDENGMRDDYRNFLFESYIRVVTHYKPRAFVFENVPGILSAMPTGEHIIDIIRTAFSDAGYVVLDDMSKAIIDFTEYGVPQRRSRVVILGLSREVYGNKANMMLEDFYEHVLPTFKESGKRTVKEAIGDLPALYPTDDYKINGKRYSHTIAENAPANHLPRWHSKRDQQIFKLLADDIASGRNEYVSSDSLKELYKQFTGHESNVHKYYVLRWNEPSNLIPAHLFKDGLRHIHPDGEQARSITVREAARLQGFPDDYEFIGTQPDQYKMIGNAVPPIFSAKLAEAVYKLLFDQEG